MKVSIFNLYTSVPYCNSISVHLIIFTFRTSLWLDLLRGKIRYIFLKESYLASNSARVRLYLTETS